MSVGLDRTVRLAERLLREAPVSGGVIAVRLLFLGSGGGLSGSGVGFGLFEGRERLLPS